MKVKEHALEGVPRPLWRLVSLARHRLLMLDFDGTLAPFAVDRRSARPLPASLERVRHIASHGHTTVAIVSGRPLREVESLLGPLPVAIVGEHGWERRYPDGTVVRERLEASESRAIETAERVARSQGWGELIERKHSAVVLHTRSLPDRWARKIQERCAEAWRTLGRGTRVALDRISGGLELRATRRHKGTVVETLQLESPPGTLGVFVGDDVTDEDAFGAVREWGFGIRVGRAERPSLAMGQIASCEAVPAFLEDWLAVTAAAAR